DGGWCVFAWRTLFALGSPIPFWAAFSVFSILAVFARLTGRSWRTGRSGLACFTRRAGLTIFTWLPILAGNSRLTLLTFRAGHPHDLLGEDAYPSVLKFFGYLIPTATQLYDWFSHLLGVTRRGVRSLLSAHLLSLNHRKVPL